METIINVTANAGAEPSLETMKVQLQQTWINKPDNWSLCLNSLLLVSVNAYKGNVDKFSTGWQLNKNGHI